MINKAKDDKWSLEVKKKYNGRCPHCGSTEGSSHHIIPRQCMRTRLVVECGIYSCNWLHRAFEGKKGKYEKEKCLRIYVGNVRLSNLEKIKVGIIKPEVVGYKEIK